MKVTRVDLIEALGELTREELEDLSHQAWVAKVDQERKAREGRSDDPLGTIRLYVGDAGHSVMWVRIAGNRWDPWWRDTHGTRLGDHELDDWPDYPVIGVMPAEWVAEQQECERDYEDEVDDDEAP